MKKIKKDFTNGSITRAIINLAIPLTLTNILFVLYQIIDTFWVGQLGKEAVAAVAVSFPILFIINSLIMGLSVSGNILVAQYKGKKDSKMIDFVSTQTILLVTIISIFLTIIGVIFSPYLISIFQVETAVYSPAVNYLSIIFIGTLFGFIFTSFSSLLRGTGEVKLPLKIVLLSVGLNFILNPILIFGLYGFPAFGVAGAAIITVFTQFISAVIAMYLLFSGKLEIHIKKECLKIDKKMILKLFKLGYPVSIEFLSRSSSMLVLTYFVSFFGTIALASFGLGTRIFSFALIPSFGLTLAINTIVGQNLGADNIPRVNQTIRKGILIAFLFLTFLGLILILFAQPLTVLFIPNEPIVTLTTIHLLFLMGISFGLMGVFFIILGAMRGAGLTKKSMNLAIFQSIIQILVAAIFMVYFGLEGIWYSYPISAVLLVFIALYYLKKVNWQKAKLV